MGILAAVGALTTSLLLLTSAVAHLRRPAALRADLAAHGVLPTRSRSLVVAVLPVAELATGGAGIVALVRGERLPLALVLAAQALLLAAFAGYLTLVLGTGRARVPCGCGLPDVPVGPAAVARAAGLAVLAAAAAVALALPGAAALAPDRDLATVALVAVAGPTLALLLAIVQPARRLPPGTRTLTLPGAAS